MTLLVLLLQMLIGAATLTPAVITYVIVEGDVPLTQDELEELAYQRGDQCSNGVGGSVYSPPERCALPVGHYGRCVS